MEKTFSDQPANLGRLSCDEVDRTPWKDLGVIRLIVVYRELWGPTRGTRRRAIHVRPTTVLKDMFRRWKDAYDIKAPVLFMTKGLTPDGGELLGGLQTVFSSGLQDGDVIQGIIISKK